MIIVWLALLSIFVLLAAIGAIHVFANIRRLSERLGFANEYLRKFNSFGDSVFIKHDLDHDSYVWLTKNVIEMQSSLGPLGIVAYRPAYENYVINSYQLLLNTLPKTVSGSASVDDMRMCIDALLRYIGVAEKRVATARKNSLNPLKWFAEGIKAVVLTPITILKWFGIVDSGYEDRASQSMAVRILSLIVGVVYLLAAMVTIVQGWQPFSSMISSLRSPLTP